MNGSSRREFLQQSIGTVVAAAAGTRTFAQGSAAADEPLYRISLAQWSLNRMLFGGKLDAFDFPALARKDFGIDAVEYVSQFFADKAKDEKYLGELTQRAGDAGVKSLLIMIDGEGALGDADDGKRKTAIENHHKWVEAAKLLGCHSIRVNAESHGSADEQRRLAADGLRRLTEFAAPLQINVIVENHGGLSSNGEWLAGVIRAVDHPRCGTLPDFGNFNIGRDAEGKSQTYDRYQGVQELMPFAKAVSAKSYHFNEKGEETTIDYRRMMKIVVDAGYHEHVGIEYEGERMSEPDGIRATKVLLERVREELAAADGSPR